VEKKHLFNDLISRTTWASLQQKDETMVDFNEATDDEILVWQWHRPDNNANNLHLAPNK